MKKRAIFSLMALFTLIIGWFITRVILWLMNQPDDLAIGAAITILLTLFVTVPGTYRWAWIKLTKEDKCESSSPESSSSRPSSE